MNYKKSKFNIMKLLLGLCMSFAMLLAGVYCSYPSFTSNAATSMGDVTTSVMSNANFNTISDSSTTPNKPTTWQLDASDSEEKVNNIKHGVINLDPDVFEEKKSEYGLSMNPGAKTSETVDQKVLLLNAVDDYSNYLGYTSGNISLSANSFYSIEIEAMTLNNGQASIYLEGVTLDNAEDKFETFTTFNTWTTYTFLIETKSSVTLNIHLMLGGRGSASKDAVLFNCVRVMRFNEGTFVSKVNLENSNRQSGDKDSTVNIINYNTPYIEGVIANPSFESPIADNNWKIIARSGSDISEQTIETRYLVGNTGAKGEPASNNSKNNSFALFMQNKSAGSIAVESSKITLSPLSYYRLSIWAWSDCGEGKGATLTLTDKADESKSTSLTTSTTVGSDTARNGWTEYSFYIYTDRYNSLDLYLQAWLGTASQSTLGYVYLDDVRLQKISYSEYNSASASSTIAKLSFNDDNTNFSVSNPFFDITQNDSYDAKYPLTPASWTKKTDGVESLIYSGVVNTTAFNADLNNSNYSNATISPFEIPKFYSQETTNNVLMMGTTQNSASVSYQNATTVTLSTSSYYKISFSFHTQYAMGTGAYVDFLNGTTKIFSAQNLVSDAKWTTYTAYVKTDAFNSIPLTIELGLKDSIGYVYFDEILVSSSTESEYNSATNSNKTVLLDYSNDSFEYITMNANTNKVLSPINFTGSDANSKEMLNNGMANVNSKAFKDMFFSTPPSAHSGDGVLVIKANNGASYTYTSKNSYSLSAGTYYKISAWIQTFDIELAHDQTEKADKLTTAGAIFKLTNIDTYFSGINTESNAGVSELGYYEYVFYINPKETVSTNIVLGLGESTALTNGSVLFDDITVSTITEDEYNALDTTDTRIIKAIYEKPAEEDNNDDNKSSFNFDWYTIPSIITALAIIIAIVGVFIQRATRNMPKRVKIKTDYDRRKTLHKDVDRREKIAIRKQIIEELNQELAEIEAELQQAKSNSDDEIEKINAEIDEIVNPIATEIENIEKDKEQITTNYNTGKADGTIDDATSKEYLKNIESLDSKLAKHKKSLEEKEENRKARILAQKEKLEKYTAKQEFIRKQIAIIEQEIEAIAKEDEKIWAEYKQAKIEAKAKKKQYKQDMAEYKQKVANAKKAEKEASAKKSNKKSDK